MTFTATERRVIGAMFRLARWATINEIAKWANDLSWQTAKDTITTLVRRRVVLKMVVGKKKYFKISL